MWTFQYKNGDRPLDGFTIQRAAGRGGFGEVYYALSDSGREVALKAVQGYEQIELRGISQCMNLKSPHLVTIFDVKYNDMGKPFVIMEFVSGPSLRQLLDESPAGLGTQKAAFFLREMGKGLTFLHECGIVHRDLKPGNVFFENGYVKIGDYGLSKAISPTQHSGQTVTVGTVHYMAPEIGVGKYDRSIDIYAMGAVLYEMLTGTVPFIGASPSEILMKHLQAEPDMSGIPEPFNMVIRKAMAKNPVDRYQTVQEMVEAVFGTEHVRMSMSHFSPDDLSMVAGRVAEKIAMGGGGNGGGSSSVVGGANGAGPSIQDPFAQAFGRLQDGCDQFRERMQEGRDRLRGGMQDRAQKIRDRFGISGLGAADSPLPAEGPTAINDPLSFFTRQMLGLLTAFAVSIASGFLIDQRQLGDMIPPGVCFFVFAAIASASIAMLVGWRKIVIPKLRNESHNVRKLTMGLIVSAVTLVGSGIFWLILINHGRFHNETWIAILAPLCFCNTWEWARANRKERVSLGPAIGVAIFGLILSSFFDGDAVLAIAVLAGTCLVVQVASPWDPVLASNRKAKGKYEADTGSIKLYGNVNVTSKQAEAMRAAGAQVYGNLNISDETGTSDRAPQRSTPPPLPARMDPGAALRSLHLAGSVHSRIFGWACVADRRRDGQRQPRCRDGASRVVRGFRNSVIHRIARPHLHQALFGPWSYLVRPAMMVGCVGTIIFFGVMLGTTNNVDPLVGAFFIIFTSLILITLPFLPRQFWSAPVANPPSAEISPHSRGLALGMACLWFCGAGGIHRFCVGKVGTGILWLLTGGLFGVGQLIDVIMICTGNFTDAEGRVVRLWEPIECTRKRQAWMAARGMAFTPQVPPVPPIPPMAGDAAPTPEATPASTPENAPTAASSFWKTGPVLPPIPPIRMPRSSGGGLASGIAALLLLLTVVFALGVGFDLPLAVANDLPNGHVAHDIRRAVFDHSPMWQVLVTKLLWATLIVLGTVSVGMMMAARRRSSTLHILRGLLGIGGLLWAVAMLTSTFHKDQGWLTIAPLIHQNQADAALDAFFKYFTDGHPITAVAICMGAFFLLTIPNRRRPAGDNGDLA